MDNQNEPGKSTWRADLAMRMAELVDQYAVLGVSQEDLFQEIIRAVARLRDQLEHDPDPADDALTSTVVDEPSNDWPAAEPGRR
ncbi:hypothetical protein [Rhizobium grahamii]|uniref:Uncharacterized protein n=2 Tax=Rhizobium grahamii TaxID=1120045 RepID=S3HTW6_9HYPH|nr:hypothetical protein [Rhizobium grahamii]EPE96626.1 hypothetical protein RGCCGE502_19710 [Rhizobium grahamii CCGE 502]RDJ03208.1 hypothetical protein B5K06_29840 [Rhizobium grahamii]